MDSSTNGIHIRIETAPDFEIPEGVRAALEQLAEAINAEAASAPEVEGFNFMDTNPLSPKTGGKFGPKGPLMAWCFGGFHCTSAYADGGGTVDCNWVYSDDY